MWTTKTKLLGLISVLLMGCGTGTGPRGKSGEQGSTGVSGTSCSVSPNNEGALIECEDGTSAQVYNGTPGEDGLDGQAGIDGKDGVDGEDGLDGLDGLDGEDGEDGEIVTVKTEVVYEGYYCGKTVVSVDTDYFLVSNGMVKLSESWYKISNTCSIRVKDDMIYTK